MNLVIDGNAFLNVSVNTVKQLMRTDHLIGEKYWVDSLIDDGPILKDRAKVIFREFTLKYIHSIISSIHDLEYVYMPFDVKGENWRQKFIETSKDERDIDYKGHRQYDENQPLFYQYFKEEVLTEISNTNIMPLEMLGAEGDDLITRILELDKSDFCIWSVDLDFCQLLSNSPRFIMLSTPKMSRKFKNVYTAENYKDSVSQKAQGFDIFNLNTTTNTDHIFEYTKKGYNHIEVNPNKELITKLISGDKSDNIPRSHSKMTPKKVEFIVNLTIEEHPDFIQKLDEDPVSMLKFLAMHIGILLKIKDENEISILKKALALNTRLMRLNSKFMPKELLSKIDETIKTLSRNRYNNQSLKSKLIYARN